MSHNEYFKKTLAAFKKGRSVRRALSVLLVLSFLCGMISPTTAQAATEYTDGDYAYTISNGEATIFYYTGSGDNITIPSTLGGYPVTTIGEYAFCNDTTLTSVKIPDSITQIDNNAFSHCSSLLSVTIPNSVTTIDYSAFAYCSSLTSVTIPDSVNTIKAHAFEHCTSLTTATIGNGVTRIDSSTFAYCSALTDVAIGNSVETIGAWAFYRCIILETIVIPDSVTIIDDTAFAECANLTDVTMGNGITTIGVGAFYECINLTTVNIPVGVTTIDSGAFERCKKLTSVTIPDSVTTIANYAFDYCSKLNDVWYQGSVTDKNNIQIGTNNGYLNDATWHYNTCAEHTYTGDCDTTCNDCEWTRTSIVSHTYDNDCDTECNICKQQRITLGHTEVVDAAVAPTCSKTGLTEGKHCSVCNKVLIAQTVVPATGAHTWNEGDTDTDGYIHYTCTVCDKVAPLVDTIAKAPADSKVQLTSDISVDLVISKNLVLDLNGFDITGNITVSPGATLSVKDSQTDDYTIEDDFGYGKIVGTISGVQAENGYLMITEADGVSFHRLNLNITTVTFRPSVAGIYYQSQFGGDEVIKRNITAYGIGLGAGMMPEFAPKTYTRFDDMTTWIVGMDENGNSNNLKNGSLLHGIMKEDRIYLLNRQYADMQIYGQAYIELADGTRILGDPVHYSLKEIVEGSENIVGVDSMWNTLTDVQKEDVLSFYNTFSLVTEHWIVPNIKSTAESR